MQKDRKKSHTPIIKYMKKINKDLSNDIYLGLNRFKIDLWSENWYRFSDNSGGILNLTFKMTDNLTNNVAFFMCDNYDYEYEICKYLNDFAIRCSSGNYGHYPHLHYVAYNIHKIAPYRGNSKSNIGDIRDEVINKYSYLKSIKIKELEK